MQEVITQLGIPTIVVILLLREIVPIIKGSSTKNEIINNPNGCLKRSEFNTFTEKVQYKSTCDEIVKRMDTRFDNVDEGIKEVKTLVKNGNNK